MPYMNLDGSEIRTEALEGATERGVDNDTLEIYLSEWESNLTARLGTFPEDDPFFRGILRDLAASDALRKVARNEEDRLKAQELRASAMERLGAYDELGAYAGSVPGVTVSVRTYRSAWGQYWIDRLEAIE